MLQQFTGNGSEKKWWYIKNNNNLGSGQTYKADFDASINDSDSGTLELVYLCCGVDGVTRNQCNADGVRTPNFTVYSTNVGAAYKTPTIGINGISSIGMYNMPSIQAHVDGNSSGDGNDTTVTWTINNSKSYAAYFYGNTTNIGNNGGYLSDSGHPDKYSSPYNYYKPSNAGVGEASEFQIKVSRRHNSTGATVYATGNSKTYRIPKIRNFVVSPRDFSGYGNTTCKWETNGSKWDSSIEQNFKTYLELSTNNWNSYETASGPTRQSGGESYVNQQITLGREFIESNVSSSIRNSSDSISAQLRVRRRNVSASSNGTSRGNVDAVSNAVSVTIQFRPKYSLSSLIFKRNSSSGSVINAGDSIIISQGSANYVSNVYVEWTYPNNNDGGIIDGYIIRIYDTVTGKLVKTYTVEAKDKYTASKLIPSADLVRARLNKISISAYYKTPNGTKSEGPSMDSDFVIPVSALAKPVIIAPGNNSQWLNKNYRVLFQLPEDPDYTYYDTDTRNNYVYRDIQLKVNNVIYSWSINPEIFSTSTISYVRKMIINPSLMSNYPNANSYILQIRVRKGYGFNYNINEDSWSEWSNSVTVSVVADSFSVKKGDLIMASHYNTLQPLCQRMKKAYPIPSSIASCKTVKRGDMIMASDYPAPYKDIKEVETAVNEYGPFDSDRNAVKFPTIPTFTPIRGEFITALSIDNSFPGRNYIRLLHDYANTLK